LVGGERLKSGLKEAGKMLRAKTGFLFFLIGLIIILLAGCTPAQVDEPVTVYVSTVVIKTPLATSSVPTPTTDPTLQPGIIPAAAAYPLSDDLNQTIVFALDRFEQNELKAGKFIRLEVGILSDQTLVFNADCDIVILQWDEETEQWFRIENGTTYGPGNTSNEVRTRDERVREFHPIIVHPILVGDREVYDIQILARGYVKGENDTVSRYVVAQLFLQLTR